MKRIKTLVLLILTVLLVAGVLCGCAVQTGEQPGISSLPHITIGSDTYPPFVYLDNNGDPTGIDVEIAVEAFRRMGYQAVFTTIDWEQKRTLVDNGEIDCIWGCFSMDGREQDYQWAGPYMVSRQIIAVNAKSDIYAMDDLNGKTIAVQSTGKPEEIFLQSGQADIPQFEDIISLEDRGVQYAALDCGYVDAIAAHETAILQYMTDYGADFRILDEPLLITGIGAAFSADDGRGLSDVRVLPEVRRQQDAALPVRLALHGVGLEKAQQLRLGVGELVHGVGDLLPLALGVDGDAARGADGQVEAAAQGLPHGKGDDNTALAVHTVDGFAQQARHIDPPFRCFSGRKWHSIPTR